MMGIFIEQLSIEDTTENSKMVLEVYPDFIASLDSLKKLTLKYGITKYIFDSLLKWFEFFESREQILPLEKIDPSSEFLILTS